MGKSKPKTREISGILVVVETMQRKILGVFQGTPDELRARIKEPKAIDVFFAFEISSMLHPVERQGPPLIQAPSAPTERQLGFVNVNQVHPLDNAHGAVPQYTCNPLGGYPVAELDPVVARTYHLMHQDKVDEGRRAIERLRDMMAKAEESTAQMMKDAASKLPESDEDPPDVAR